MQSAVKILAFFAVKSLSPSSSLCSFVVIIPARFTKLAHFLLAMSGTLVLKSIPVNPKSGNAAPRSEICGNDAQVMVMAYSGDWRKRGNMMRWAMVKAGRTVRGAGVSRVVRSRWNFVPVLVCGAALAAAGLAFE